MTATMSSKKVSEVVVLLCCVAITGVLANCIGRMDSVEERTRRVPLVIKGIVVARSHTGNRLTIRVGRILKGGNESVSGTEVDLAILESQESTTSTTTTGLTSNVTNAVRITTTDTPGMPTSPGGVQSNSSAAGEITNAAQQTTPAATCLEGLGILDRYIFFLRPLDDGRLLFEVAEDGVPQTRDNLRRIRQTVKEEQEVNYTLPEDDHRGSCTEPTYVDHYCLNGGTCGIWRGVEKYFCICNYPYHGERCEQVDPALKKEDRPVDANDTTVAVAVIMSALLVITVICAVAYIKYKNSVWRERKREVEKTVKYLQERYPSRPSSRRDSPIEGVLRLKQNWTSTDDEGAPQVIIFQEADGKHSRQGSLSSNQYRLLTEVLAQPHRPSADYSEHVPHRDSRSSIV